MDAARVIGEAQAEAGGSLPVWGGSELLSPHLMKPLRETISAWQSLTVSPFRLRESPLTQRFPGTAWKANGKRSKESDDEAGTGCLSSRLEAETASLYQTPTPTLSSLGKEDHAPLGIHWTEINLRLFSPARNSPPWACGRRGRQSLADLSPS